MKSRRDARRPLIEPLESRILLSAFAVTTAIHPAHGRAAPTISLPHLHAPAPKFKGKHVAAQTSPPAPPAIPLASPVVALSTFTAPTASLSSASTTEADLAASPATGGSGHYSYQWYRGTSAGFAPSSANAIPGATQLTFADTAIAPGVPYFYLLAATDGASTVYSNQVIGALSIPTMPIDLPYQSGPVLIATLGSSTWAINQGSGQVPTMTAADLRSSFPSANISMFNGAVSGTSTPNFLPGQPMNNAIKSAVTSFSGYKVLRLMIGSNDAYVGRSAADWLANMQAIIQDALTWPVDLIVVEEIGVRLDQGNGTLDLIRQYDAARSSLLGPKVVLGTAHTFENQAIHIDLLSPDKVHQSDPGQIDLAAQQATELSDLFTPPTTLNFTQDNAAYDLSVDPGQSVVEISAGTSPGGVPLFSYPLAGAPALSINLGGADQSLTIDFANGSPAPAGLSITSDHVRHDSVYIQGQNPAQPFNLTDYQLTPPAGGAISYKNLSELHLLRGTFNYTGGLATLDNLEVGNQATFYWL